MAKYKMLEMPDLRQTGERKSYPRMEITGQTSMEELVEAVVRRSTFGKGEVSGILMDLADCLAQEMKRGHSVKIDGVGTFTPALGLKADAQPETADDVAHRNAQSIEVRGVNFRPDKKLVRETGRGIVLERSSKKTARSSDKHSPEKRAEMARAFLQSRPFMTVADYCALTGLLSTMAGRELRALAADPASGIGTAGRGSHRVYVRIQAEADA